MNITMDIRKFFGKKKSVSKPKRRVRVAVTRMGKATPALRKAVKSIVAGQMEAKNETRVLESYVLHNSAITSGDWTYPVPSIAQGDGETQRQGDRINPKALIVKVHVSFASGVGGHPTVKCRLVCLKHKKFTSEATLSANISTEAGKLLDAGNGTVDFYDGTIQNSQYALNTEVWSPIKILNFTLSKDNTCPTQGSAFREFTIRIPCPKTFVYSDGANLPENFCPAMALGYGYIDGTGPDVVTTPVMMYAQSYFTYTDA